MSLITYFDVRYALGATLTFHLFPSELKHFKELPAIAVVFSSFSIMSRSQFTPQQSAFLVRENDRRNTNVARVSEIFREQYPDVRCPSRVAVYKNVAKYTVNGTSCNLNKGFSSGAISSLKFILHHRLIWKLGRT